MTVRVFKGYEGLFTEFWGFTNADCMDFNGCTLEELGVRLGDFWQQPIVMVGDEAEYDHVIMQGYVGRDLNPNTCLGVRCIDLNAESFNSRLFLQADLDRLMAASNGAITQEHFLQEEA